VSSGEAITPNHKSKTLLGIEASSFLTGYILPHNV